MSQSIKDKLIDILIKNCLLTSEQLDTAVEVQKKKGGLLSDILIELNFLSKDDIMASLSQQLDIPPIDLSKLNIDSTLTTLISVKFARQYQIMPVSKLGKMLTVAMADPLNVFVIDDIKTLTGFKICPVIASREDIVSAIDRYYGAETQDAMKEVMDAIKIKEEEQESDYEGVVELTEESPIIKITNLILTEGLRCRTTDIMFEPLEEKLRIRYRVDGVLHEARTFPKSMLNPIISRIKVISDLDIAEHRIPQDGRFRARILNREVDFRVSVMPSSMGEKIVLRVLDKSQATLDLKKLGFEEEAMKRLKKASARPYGMILVTGPTGSGKTTTLYSILKLIDSPAKNIVTVEDPVEYQLEGINQVTARPDIGLSFAGALRSILRQDPDVIMIGEMRDYETVDIGIKAALTGHLVLSTLHTNDASSSITRMVNMGIEPFLINSSLIFVGAQRLLRKLCEECKKPYEIPEILKEKVGLKDIDKETTLYKAVGCDRCGNTGYRGRIAILEPLIMSVNLRRLVGRRARDAEIKKVAREEGMATLRENGLKKALKGETSLEEVVRLTLTD